jgi:hypothetical protein
MRVIVTGDSACIRFVLDLKGAADLVVVVHTQLLCRHVLDDRKSV